MEISLVPFRQVLCLMYRYFFLDITSFPTLPSLTETCACVGLHGEPGFEDCPDAHGNTRIPSTECPNPTKPARSDLICHNCLTKHSNPLLAIGTSRVKGFSSLGWARMGSNNQALPNASARSMDIHVCHERKLGGTYTSPRDVERK